MCDPKLNGSRRETFVVCVPKRDFDVDLQTTQYSKRGEGIPPLLFYRWRPVNFERKNTRKEFQKYVCSFETPVFWNIDDVVVDVQQLIAESDAWKSRDENQCQI